MNLLKDIGDIRSNLINWHLIYFYLNIPIHEYLIDLSNRKNLSKIIIFVQFYNNYSICSINIISNIDSKFNSHSVIAKLYNTIKLNMPRKGRGARGGFGGSANQNNAFV